MEGGQNLTAAGGEGRPRIVAGVHGTAASDAAVKWAAREARLRQAQLHLVLARDPAASRHAPYARPAAPASGDADAVWLTAAAVRAAGMLPPGRITTEVAAGLPASVLADRAAGADLLVLGAGRPGRFLGPVARACLCQAPCPVVIVAADSCRDPAVPDPRRAAEPAAGRTLAAAAVQP